MLMRWSDFVGGGGGRGAGGAAGISTGFDSDSGCGCGPVVHAAINSIATVAVSERKDAAALVTEANPEDINLRHTQAAAQHVQLIEIIGRADVDTVIVAIVDLDALNV